MIYWVELKHDKAVYAQAMGFTFVTYWFAVANSEEEARSKVHVYFEVKYEAQLEQHGGYVTKSKAKEALCQVEDRYLELIR